MTEEPKRGRPTVMTDAARDTVAEALRLGMSFANAARLAGIGRQTIFDERRRNRDFRTALRKAAAEYEKALLGGIADSPDWRAKAFLLARRFPSRGGKQREEPKAGKQSENGMVPLLVPVVATTREEIATLESLRERMEQLERENAALRGASAVGDE